VQAFAVSVQTLTRRAEMPGDTAFLEGPTDRLSGLAWREPAERVVKQLDNLDLVAGGHQVIGELAADQPGAENHHSAAIAQLSDIVLGLERDQQHADPEIRNTTCVRVLKNRFVGLTGPACYLYYDKESGRMIETNCPVPDDKAEF